MMLQALPDVNLTLFNTFSNKINFMLESSHGWHKLSKCSFYIKGRRHSLWWWYSCCGGNWWRIRNTTLASCRNCTLGFMWVWMPRGSGIRDLGLESEISVDECQILCIWTPWFRLVRPLALLFSDVLVSFCVFVFCRSIREEWQISWENAWKFGSPEESIDWT